MEFNNPNAKLAIKDYDYKHEVSLELGCYRETNRLTRVVRVFQKAVTLADRYNLADELIGALVGLYDHKGRLDVTWKNESKYEKLYPFIDKAWDDEGEVLITHIIRTGYEETVVYDMGDTRAKDLRGFLI